MPVPLNMMPGDVLAYRGKGLISWCIRLFDGGPFSHVGLYLGDGEVGEAIADGVVRQGFDDSVDGAEWLEYRRLRSGPTDMLPVLRQAEHYLFQGQRYAYEQILLLAMLAVTRRLPVNRFLARVLRATLDRAARLLADLLDGGREPMICSEFVYRCYEEALPGTQDPYALRVAPWPGAGALAPTVAPEPRASRGIHTDSLAAWFAELSMSGGAGAPAAVARALERDTEGTAVAVTELDDELQAALKAYRDGLEGPAEEQPVRELAAIAMDIRTPEIYSRINLFLGLLSVTTGAPAARSAPPGVTGTAPPEWRVFSSTTDFASEVQPRVRAALRPVADFVTPRDLYVCDSLREVGRV